MGAAVVASSRSLPRGGVTTTTQHRQTYNHAALALAHVEPLFSVRTHRRNWTQKAGGLVEAELPANPMLLLDEWLAAALKDGHIIERGFVLATSCADEGPTARTVVCRDVCEDGSITFGTNLTLSRAGVYGTSRAARPSSGGARGRCACAGRAASTPP